MGFFHYFSFLILEEKITPSSQIKFSSANSGTYTSLNSRKKEFPLQGSKGAQTVVVPERKERYGAKVDFSLPIFGS